LSLFTYFFTPYADPREISEHPAHWGGLFKFAIPAKMRVVSQKGVFFMKNTFKFLGTVAFAAVIGFSMAACDTGSVNGGDGLPPGGDGSVTFTPGAPMTFPVVDEHGAPVSVSPAINFTDVRETDGYSQWPMAISAIAATPGEWEVRLDGDTLSVMLGTPMETALTHASDWLDDYRAQLIPHTGSFSASTGVRILVINGFTVAGQSIHWEQAALFPSYGHAFFVYANIAGTASGVLRFYDGGRLEGTIAMNMDLRRGWNTATTTLVVDPGSGIFSYTIVSGEPGADFRWVLE